MKTTLLYLYGETALHAGAGSAISAVDLPIQRERTTDFPNIQGSGVKGAMRGTLAQKFGNNSPELDVVFGPDVNSNRAHEYAGALSVGEARIVLFPVRSLTGIFAFVTCPYVLARLERDAAQAGVLDRGELTLRDDERPMFDLAWGTQASEVAPGGSLVLEEFAFNAHASGFVDGLARWIGENALPEGPEYNYWRRKLLTSLVILPDDAFRDFVRNSTEIVTRVRLDNDTKTVARGALWTQEALPPDTLLVSCVSARQVRAPRRNDNDALPAALGNGSADEVLDWIQKQLSSLSRFQIGGDETTGLGVVAARMQKG